MNPVSSINVKRWLLVMQIVLIISAVILGFFNSEVASVLGSLIAFYQVGSAIYVRKKYRGDLGVFRETYESILFGLALFMLVVFIPMTGEVEIFSMEFLFTFGYIYGLIALSLTPKILAFMYKPNPPSLIPWGVYIVLLLILMISLIVVDEGRGLLFLGLFIMLFAGPLLAGFYLSIEMGEIHRHNKASKHSPIDL